MFISAPNPTFLKLGNKVNQRQKEMTQSFKSNNFSLTVANLKFYKPIVLAVLTHFITEKMFFFNVSTNSLFALRKKMHLIRSEPTLLCKTVK